MICRRSNTCRAGHRCEHASELKHNQTFKIHYFDSILFQMLLSWVRSIKYSSKLCHGTNVMNNLRVVPKIYTQKQN